MTDLALVGLLQQAQDAALRQDYAMATEVCSEILKTRRNQPNALLILAQIALQGGSNNLAITHLQKAIKSAPGFIKPYVRLGQIHQAHGNYQRAHAFYDRALKIDPRHAETLASKAEAYERQDRYDRAERLLQPHLTGSAAIDPAIAAVMIRLHLKKNELEPAIALGEEVRRANARPNTPLRNALFSLAKAHERAGNIETAFQVAEEANAINRPPFEVDDELSFVESAKETFSSEVMATLPRASVPTELPIFIVGMPRSGSTLIERIIDAHPDAHGAGELSSIHVLAFDLPSRIDATQAYPQCVTELTQDHVDTMSGEYLRELRAKSPRSKRVSNKDLGAFRHLGLVNALFPHGRVIHCRRNPLDTCLSCFMERIRPASAPYATDLRHLGHAFRAYYALMAHWRSVLDVPFLEVSYEELINDPESAVRTLIEFCGLPWNDRCLRFHETRRHDRTLSYDQVRRPLYRSSINRAARFGSLLDPLREALAGDDAAADEM